MTKMTSTTTRTLEQLESLSLTNCESIFQDSNQDRDDFIDDMTGHFLRGGFRFCIDLQRETDAELRRAGRRLDRELRLSGFIS